METQKCSHVSALFYIFSLFGATGLCYHFSRRRLPHMEVFYAFVQCYMCILTLMPGRIFLTVKMEAAHFSEKSVSTHKLQKTNSDQDLP